MPRLQVPRQVGYTYRPVTPPGFAGASPDAHNISFELGSRTHFSDTDAYVMQCLRDYVQKTSSGVLYLEPRQGEAPCFALAVSLDASQPDCVRFSLSQSRGRLTDNPVEDFKGEFLFSGLIKAIDGNHPRVCLEKSDMALNSPIIQAEAERIFKSLIDPIGRLLASGGAMLQPATA